MKNEKKSYLIPCADIVDIRMEGSLLEGSMPDDQRIIGTDEPGDDV